MCCVNESLLLRPGSSVFPTPASPVASEIIAAGFYSRPVQMRETNYFLRQNAPNVVCVRAPAGLRIPLPTPVYGLWLCWIFIRGLFTGNQSEGPARCSAVGPAVGQIQQGPQPCVTDRTSTTIQAIPSASPPPRPLFFFAYSFCAQIQNQLHTLTSKPVTSGPVT